MHHKDIIFGGQNFSIFPSGELYWKDKKTLIISDVHFEKGSSYSESNQFIPPFDTIETLKQLTKFINAHAVESIIFLIECVKSINFFLDRQLISSSLQNSIAMHANNCWSLL